MLKKRYRGSCFVSLLQNLILSFSLSLSGVHFTSFLFSGLKGSCFNAERLLAEKRGKLWKVQTVYLLSLLLLVSYNRGSQRVGVFDRLYRIKHNLATVLLLKKILQTIGLCDIHVCVCDTKVDYDPALEYHCTTEWFGDLDKLFLCLFRGISHTFTVEMTFWKM